MKVNGGQRTFEAVTRLLLYESRVQPVLLLFEDLHWIDTESQALLDFVVHSLAGARMLVLVSYRPEYQHGWGSLGHYTQLRLDSLLAGEARELLDHLLGSDPALEPLRHRLIEWTEGNPFFLEESVRALEETGWHQTLNASAQSKAHSPRYEKYPKLLGSKTAPRSVIAIG